MQITVTPNGIITAVAVITAVGTLIGLLFALFKWLERQRRQDDDIKSLKKEMTLVCYCMSSVLDGLLQQGCNHTVPAAKEKLDKYLNQKAHDQFEE